MNHRPGNLKSLAPLDLSVKKKFPFSLACPSFIYSAGYVENVRRLAPFVDEIQLLFFESRPRENLPTRELMVELQALAERYDITYNVHLPTDLYPGHPDADERHHASDTLAAILRRCEPLDPSTYTLHVNPNPAHCEHLSASAWEDALIAVLAQVLESGIPGRKISVENVDDGLERVEHVIRKLDLSVCMDLGHLMVSGGEVDSFYSRWRERISVIHFHGVKNGKDHLPLNCLSPQKRTQAMGIVSRFKGPVTVEVYSRDALNASCRCLLKWLDSSEPNPVTAPLDGTPS